MRVEKLTVSRTKKVNLGNYESAEILVSATADVDTNENPLEVGAKLASMAAQLLEQYGPKDLEQRAREKAAVKTPPSTSAANAGDAAPTSTASPSTTVTPSASLDPEKIVATIKGAKLQRDTAGREHLKQLGFTFNRDESSWSGAIVRAQVREISGWCAARGLTFDFKVVKA